MQWNALYHLEPEITAIRLIVSHAMRQARLRLHISQRVAAERIGVSKITYFKWETGKTKLIGPGYIAAIAAALEPAGSGPLNTLARQVSPHILAYPALLPEPLEPEHVATVAPDHPVKDIDALIASLIPK
jgi:transcriptional regulator with XRE-family HTH domain